LSGSIFGDAEAAMVGKNAALRHRFYGVTLPATTPVNARFTMHYNEVYGTSLSRADAPSTDYDAFYLLAYASFAAPDGPLTGAALAKVFPRLAGTGPKIDVGPSGIFQSFAALSSGGAIDLNGAATSLDFDPATGEENADLAVLCFDVGKDGATSGSVESGVVYDARADKLVGRAKCP
jgi:hypothetical protein